MMPNQMAMALEVTPRAMPKIAVCTRGHERNATKREGNGHGTHANESHG